MTYNVCAIVGRFLAGGKNQSLNQIKSWAAESVVFTSRVCVCRMGRVSQRRPSARLIWK